MIRYGLSASGPSSHLDKVLDAVLSGQTRISMAPEQDAPSTSHVDVAEAEYTDQPEP